MRARVKVLGTAYLLVLLVGVPAVTIAGRGGAASSPDSVSLSPFSFGRDDLEITRRDGFDDIVLRGAVLQQPQERLGHPLLPTLKLDVLVPAGKKIASVTVEAADSVHIVGAFLPRPIQRYRESDGRFPAVVPPDPEIYASPVPYPAALGEVTLNGAMRGYRLGTVVVHPLQYVGRLQRLILHRSITVHVTFAALSPDEEAGMVVRSQLCNLPHCSAMECHAEQRLRVLEWQAEERGFGRGGDRLGCVTCGDLSLCVWQQ